MDKKKTKKEPSEIPVPDTTPEVRPDEDPPGPLSPEEWPPAYPNQPAGPQQPEIPSQQTDRY